MRLRVRPPRRGISLLEVLVAVVIFLMAFGAISELVSQSAQRALYVQQQEQAALLCESKLEEVVCGAIPFTSQNEVPLEEDPNWLWSLQCEQNGQLQGLWNVQVRVSRLSSDGRRVECVLDRMVLDPALRGSTLDSTTISGTESTDTGTSTQGGTSTPQGGQP